MFVIDSKQKSGLLLDGKPLPANHTSVEIPGTQLVRGYVGISVGTNIVTHTNQNTTIGAILFGKAELESYGFPVGPLAEPINKVMPVFLPYIKYI